MKRVIWAVLVLSLAAFASDDKLTVQDIIQKHVASVGAEQARSGLSFHDFSGKVTKRPLTGSGTATGDAQLASEARQLKLATDFHNGETPDQFVFDGKKAMISQVRGVRSSLGNFFYWQTPILAEGLIGGTMSTAWPLLDLQKRSAKVSYDGLKKIEGKQYHQLRYEPKSNPGSVSVRLFLDPETFRHVMTYYDVVVASGQGANNVDTQNRDTRYHVEELFSDFRVFNGVTLPVKQQLRYTVDGSNSAAGFILDFEYEKLNGVPVSAAPAAGLPIQTVGK